MKANRMWFFSDLLEKNKRVFKVPVYQRNYDWMNIQCEKLFSDIMKASERDVQHFTGTVVYMDDVNGGSGLNEVLIIDGQQRITTMYILLKALYDASMGVSMRIESELKDVMFNRNCDEKYKIKLKPVKSDDEQLKFLINNKIDRMNRDSNVYKNYITFKKLIDEKISEGFGLEDILEGIKKLEVVEIILDKQQGDEPQKIFESINSTGLELSLADLIRNYLLMDDKNQDELYYDYWMEIEKNVGYQNLGNFVINYLNSVVIKSVNNKNAYTLFKENCEENNLSHEDVLKKMRRVSKYYGSFIGENSFYSENVQSYLRAFKKIKQTTVLPLLFHIFNDFEDGNIKEEELCNVLEYLLTYIIRRITCEINKNLAKFMKSLYGRAIAGKYERYYDSFATFLNNLKSNDRMPTDKEFKDALIYKPLYNKNICKFLLSEIENSSKEHIDTSNLTIEHILPQKENSVLWKKELGDDYTRVYEVYLHTLGNLTFTGYNSELGTKSFEEKKKLIVENSKMNVLNKEVISQEKWNEEAILTRAEYLANLVIKKFPYIKIDKIKEEDELCFCIINEFDFTNTKPSGFSFIGEFTKVNSWADLLSKFIEMGYDLNRNVFISLANKNYIMESGKRIYITHDERELRKGKEIGKSGIFYETNFSANSIISFIKELILQLNQDIEDFNVYLSELPFDINNKETWYAKGIKIDKLFYFFIKDLIEKNKISYKEIEKLKTKEYTESVFTEVGYPAILDDVSYNKIKSKTKIYRKASLKYGDIEVFTLTKFSESNREDIIKWYEKHLFECKN